MSTNSRPQPSASAAPRCPFCHSTETELFSLFGSQLLTEQWYCRACRTPFEYVRDAEVPDDAGLAGQRGTWDEAH